MIIEMVGMMLMILIMGVLMLFSFLIGARTAQKAHKGEEIKLPSINPIEMFEKHEEQKMIEQAEYERNLMLENINNYNGTGLGQKEIK